MVTVSLVTDNDEYATDIRGLLVDYDHEFVPPLSARTSTVQNTDLDDDAASDIYPYFESCIEQTLIVAEDGGDVVGFLSFRVAEEKDGLEAYSPCVYVSTTIVDTEYRQHGVATQMNRLLLDEIVPTLPVEYVARRTWSTNHASMAYIESLGFEVVNWVEDDRGEGIDSVYYAKSVTKE